MAEYILQGESAIEQALTGISDSLRDFTYHRRHRAPALQLLLRL
jgi:hypothetical protein